MLFFKMVVFIYYICLKLKSESIFDFCCFCCCKSSKFSFYVQTHINTLYSLNEKSASYNNNTTFRITNLHYQ